ncbi:MAG: hypothetical protein JSU91_04235 [Thermoplasmatales archaeon]|nr:MAG: hypothetical protein JSU91_04235 [Thermoplasmatales archaeon]
MKIKLIAFGIIFLFITTAFTSSIGASFFIDKTKENLKSSETIFKIKGIILRSYVVGDAIKGKKIGFFALIDFTNVEFKTIRLFPPGVGYVSYENVSVLIIGLKSEIPDGAFHLDTITEKNKVSSIIFK